MNDDELRERARERLLTAELRTVLAEPNPGVVASRGVGRQVYAAALVLLGIAVAFGAAWLSRTTESVDRDAAQEPVFDPVDPWFEQEDPFRPGLFKALHRPDRDPSPSDEFAVSMRDGESAELREVLDRPIVRRLALAWGNRNQPATIAPNLWQRIATLPHLEVLWLSGPFALSPEQLRELRLLPALRHLALLDSAATLDEASARSLVELPRLRGLLLGMIDAKREGLEILAGLPNLAFVAIARLRLPIEVTLTSLTKIRSLQAIVIDHDGQQEPPKGSILRELAKLPRLQALGVAFWPLDDEALAALPSGLSYLGFSGDRSTPAGIGQLRRLTRLRTLRLTTATPTHLVHPLAELLPKLTLERFDATTQSPDPVVWAALHQLPKLRRMSLRATGKIETAIANCLACPHLEHITFVGDMPNPEQLAPLRGHSTLLRITLLPDYQKSIDAPELEALRAVVRAKVEVTQR